MPAHPVIPGSKRGPAKLFRIVVHRECDSSVHSTATFRGEIPIFSGWAPLSFEIFPKRMENGIPYEQRIIIAQLLGIFIFILKIVIKIKIEIISKVKNFIFNSLNYDFFI